MTYKIIISSIVIVAVCSLGAASVSASQVAGVISSAGIFSPSGAGNAPSGSQVSGTFGKNGSVSGTVSGGSNAISGTITGGNASVGGAVAIGSASGSGVSEPVIQGNPSGSVLGASTIVANSVFPIVGVRSGGTTADAGIGLSDSAGLLFGAPIVHAALNPQNSGVNNQPTSAWNLTILLMLLALVLLVAFIVYEMLKYRRKNTNN